MKTSLINTLLIFFILSTPFGWNRLFAQVTDSQKHTFIISNTKTDVVKEINKTTVKAMLSGYTAGETKKFKENISLSKGIISITIEPLTASTFACNLVIDTLVNKRTFHQYLTQAGIVYLTIDDIHCPIEEYWRKIEQSKAIHTK